VIQPESDFPPPDSGPGLLCVATSDVDGNVLYHSVPELASQQPKELDQSFVRVPRHPGAIRQRTSP
jgi:hypothetical protein